MLDAIKASVRQTAKPMLASLALYVRLGIHGSVGGGQVMDVIEWHLKKLAGQIAATASEMNAKFSASIDELFAYGTRSTFLALSVVSRFPQSPY